MEPQVYDEIASLEEWHWWFVGIRQALLDQLLPAAAGATVLDAGCGAGGTLRELKNRGVARAVGFDFSPLALKTARERAPGAVLNADLTRLPFADRAFDLVYCADVIEHIPDDRAAVAEIARVLKPGGRVGIAVPAFQELWTEHDDANHHQRRYRRGQLVALVEGAGLTIERSSYLNMTLGVPIAGYRLWRRFFEWMRGPRKPDSDIKPMPKPLNAFGSAVFTAERRLLASADLPFGTSVMVVARKA